MGVNEVTLVGRVPVSAEERTLPSGDVLVSWRLVVERPPPRRPLPEGVRPASVDTIDCVAFAAGVRRTSLGFAPGDVVRVEGALHRRFWRSANGAASRYEVEVSAARRVARAPAA